MLPSFEHPDRILSTRTVEASRDAGERIEVRRGDGTRDGGEEFFREGGEGSAGDELQREEGVSSSARSASSASSPGDP